MKVVVFSDVHGAQSNVERILDLNQDADYFISLGDTELEQQFLVHNDIVMIKGNYHHDAGFVFERDMEIEGVKIFLTHGHKYGVQRGLKKLAKFAIQNEYQLVLFGHTHVVDQTKIGPVQFLNPGSCSQPRNTLPPTYLIIDITEGKFTWRFQDIFTNQTIEV